MDKIAELEIWQDKIHAIGKENGLDFYDMIYEIVPDDVMYTFGSYGMPNRFHHWSFGKHFYRMQKMRKLGLMKIYELVINTNPCFAFLLDSNTILENKMIIAHVLGHSDFFKNNRKFKPTNTNILDEMKVHSEKIKNFETKYGMEEVEKVVDLAMTIEEQKLLLKAVQKSPILKEWQRHILDMFLIEAEYFAPQAETKIINEGWATYWHHHIMGEILEDEKEILQFSKFHSGIIAPNPKGINPYLLGFKIFQDIEEKFGRDKLFQVRELESDVTFIRKYYTQEIAENLNMYVYKEEKDGETKVTEVDFEEVKTKLIHSMINRGYPTIVDATYENDEFAIRHEFDGRKIDSEQLHQVLKTIYPFVGKQYVNFYTIMGGKETKLQYNGEKMDVLYV